MNYLIYTIGAVFIVAVAVLLVMAVIDNDLEGYEDEF